MLWSSSARRLPPSLWVSPLHEMKRLLSLLLILAMLLSLSACASEEDIELLVQGNLDELYLGKFSSDYMELTGSSEAECLESYERGIAAEAKLFTLLYSVENPSDALMDDIAEMYREIYSYAKYSVSKAERQSDGSFSLTVKVYPIDIFRRVEKNWDKYMEDFYSDYGYADVDSMSEIERAAFEAAWADSIIAAVYSCIPSLGYLKGVSIPVRVEKIDGYWTVSEEDFYQIDENIIYYP